MVNVINLLLGSSLLVAGRKLFWLFVGALGFITGMELAARIWRGPEIVAIIVGLIIGIIFAVLAVFIEALAIGVAGFLAGGFVLTTLTNMVGLNQGIWFWIFYAIGGIIGILLVLFLFDWALITLSSLAGAALIVQAVLPRAGVSSLLFIVLVIAGIVIQGAVLQREEHPPVRRYRYRRVRRIERDVD